MPNPFECEIIELHQFFEHWFNARLPNQTQAFARFLQVMVPNFSIVAPSGRSIKLPELQAGLQAAYGQHPGVKIWVEKVEILQKLGDVTIVSYEEWQADSQSAVTAKGRISTAVFLAMPNTPNGLQWLRVHETWLPFDA